MAALIIRDGAILLTPPWETDRGSQRLWNAPGGALEPYESIEEALKREAYEEVGAQIDPLGLAFLTQQPRTVEEMTAQPKQPVMSIEVCCYARLVCKDDDLRPEHPFIPPPTWVPFDRVATLPTLPFSLRGWAKWVADRGYIPQGVPIAPVQSGVGLDALYAPFKGFTAESDPGR